MELWIILVAVAVGLALSGRELFAATCMLRGSQLDARQQFAAACAVYERGLATLSPREKRCRSVLLIRLAYSLQQAGRGSKAVERITEALRLPLKGDLEIIAHAIAGLVFQGQGAYPDADREFRAAQHMAEGRNKAALAADCLLQQGAIAMEQGQLKESRWLRRCALDASATAQRGAHLIEAECLRAEGRFREAAAELDRARAASPLPNAGLERRTQGLLHWVSALVYLEAFQGEPAARHLEQARPLIGVDDRFRLWLVATEAAARAVAGERESSLARIDQAARGARRYTGDRLTQLVCAAMLARTAYALQDWSRSRDAWEVYLRLQPQPLFVPGALYFLGETARQQGDLAATRTAFHQAIAANLDTYYSRLARERLAELKEPV